MEIIDFLIHLLISFSRSPSKQRISLAFPWKPQLLSNTKLSNIHSRTLTDGTRGRERKGDVNEGGGGVDRQNTNEETRRRADRGITT